MSTEYKDLSVNNSLEKAQMFKMSLNHFNNFLTHVNNIDIYNFTSWFDIPHDFELHTILGSLLPI